MMTIHSIVNCDQYALCIEPEASAKAIAEGSMGNILVFYSVVR